jgi:hypothetical protein
MNPSIEQILSYCQARGISPATFGNYAVNDGKLVARLMAGGEMLPRTARRVAAYMAANPTPDDAPAPAVAASRDNLTGDEE